MRSESCGVMCQSILARSSSQFTYQPPAEHGFDLALKLLRPNHAPLLDSLPNVRPLVCPHGSLYPDLIDLLTRFGMRPQSCIPGIFIEQGVGYPQRSPPITAPAICPWMLHHSCAHRIQFDIPAAHHQVLVSTDDRTFIPSLLQGPRALIGIVDIAHVPSPHTLHTAASVSRLPKLHEQVYMVSHQGVGIEP